MPATTAQRSSSPTAVSAPYHRLVSGVRNALGYDMEQDGDRLTLRFVPWFTEWGHPHREPCLRLVFRKQGDWAVLERFYIDDEDGPRPMDIVAARDALQAWVDCVCD